MYRRLVRLCLVGARALHIISSGGNFLVAGGKDGVNRGFLIPDFGFFPAVAGHAHAWILDFLIIPGVQVIEVLGVKKQRYWGCFESDK